MNLATEREFAEESPTLRSGPEHRSISQFRLEVIEGPSAGKVIVSNDLRVVIGSDPGADLQLEDDKVLPYQCELIATSEHVEIVDLARNNSTMVNDIAVKRAQLYQRTTIRVGASVLQFTPVSVALFVRRSRDTSFAGLVGNSPAMRDLFVVLASAAQQDMPLLLQGETGTGKETAARAIHQMSTRSAGVFHSIDCKAPHDEIEAALIAAFESTAGGTLYLSEIGQLPKALQARLLRVFKIGGPGAVADLRIISSTSVDLRFAVNDMLFSERLYVHLSGLLASLPAMRDRYADLPRLIDNILDRTQSAQEPIAVHMRTREFQSQLMRYGWPGNVRELQEYLRRCVSSGTILPLDVTGARLSLVDEEPVSPLPPIDISKPIKAGREEWIKHFERLYLAEVLQSQGGNVTRAAKAASVDRGHFYRLMMRCGLR